MSPTPQNSSDREKMIEEFNVKFAAIEFAHKPDGIYASDVRDVVADWLLDKMFPSPSVEKVPCYCGEEIGADGEMGPQCMLHNPPFPMYSPKSEVSGKWSDELDKVHNDSDCCNREQVRMLVYKLLSSQRQSLEREHKEWKERVVGKVEKLERWTNEPDWKHKSPVQKGQDAGWNSALEQVKHLLLNEE